MREFDIPDDRKQEINLDKSMRKILLSVLLALMLLIYPANNANAFMINQGGTSDTSSNTVTTANSNPCAYNPPENRPIQSEELQNPDTIVSNNGVLQTELTVEYGDNKIEDCPVHIRSYNGKLVGPTLRVHPKDKIKINLVNNLPPDKESNYEHLKPVSKDGCDYFIQDPAIEPINTPHGFNTTNFHFHGLNVDPEGCGDNILRIMTPKKNQGESAPEYAIEVTIPEEHPAGTFWYHAHKHGSTALQVSSAMGGAIIIENNDRGLDTIPEIAAAKEKVLVFQQIAYDEKGEIEDYTNTGPNWAKIGRKITINGQVVPEITMQPGEVQRWRMIHGGIGESLYLELRESENEDTKIAINEIAVDGIALGKVDSWIDSPLAMQPGNRSDVLVKANPLPSGTQQQEYLLIDQPSSKNLSLRRIEETENILAKVIVKGDPLDMSLPTDDQIAQAKSEDAPKDILDSEITGDIPQIVFNKSKDTPPQFTINGTEFNTEDVIDLKLNQAQKWSIASKEGGGNHPYHIHVNPFQYDRQDPDGNTERIWRDTLFIPDGETREIRTRYERFIGEFVVHCHILDHEDQGMMELAKLTN